MATTINYIASFLIILFIPPFITSESPSIELSTPSNNKGLSFASGFNPSTAIITVLLLSSFFFLAFFSIYIRNCNNNRNGNSPNAAAIASDFVHFQHAGLNRQLLQSFPTMVYAEVKPHKIERSELQCAICLGEFDDEDIIRLLPACDHVFHLDCIDAWLATHVTCPVCRTNYNLYSPTTTASPEAVLSPDVAIVVDDVEGRKEEMRELAALANKVRRSKRLSRCYSTGNLMMGEGEESFNRYTLRLPENLRKEIVLLGA